MKGTLKIIVTYHDVPHKDSDEMQHSTAGLAVFKQPYSSGLLQTGMEITPDAGGFSEQYFAFCVKFLADMINDIAEIEALVGRALEDKAIEISEAFKALLDKKPAFKEALKNKVWKNIVLKLLDLKAGKMVRLNDNFSIPYVGILRITAQNVVLASEKTNKLKR